MKNKKSSAKELYSVIYSDLRSDSEGWDCVEMDSRTEEIYQCAQDSYENGCVVFEGWKKGERFERFYRGVQTNSYSIWSIPF